MKTRKPLQRTAFKRKRAEGPSAPKESHPKALTPATRTATYAGSITGALPKEPQPVRDEARRRLVAALPCYACGIHGYSNAAHPNSGKAKGKKLSDAGCFPLCCDRPGIKGCHPKFDQYEIVSAEEMPAYERAALEWTRQQLGATT